MYQFSWGYCAYQHCKLVSKCLYQKLLAPSPQGMPLRVQYDETDSNSIQIWLERWSISCPWKPVSPPKKTLNSKSQKKQGNSQAVEGEIVKPKRSVRKVPSLFDSGSEKPRRNLKKVSSLRKVHNPVNESSTLPEVTERPPQEKTMTSSVQEIQTPNEVKPIEIVKEETAVILKEEAVITVPKENGQETIEDPIGTSESIVISSEEIIKVKSDFEVNELDENTPVPNGEFKPTIESTPSDNQKSSRRASFSAKQEHVEDGLHNTTKLPSYMQATQICKGKVESTRFP